MIIILLFRVLEIDVLEYFYITLDKTLCPSLKRGGQECSEVPL